MDEEPLPLSRFKLGSRRRKPRRSGSRAVYRLLISRERQMIGVDGGAMRAHVQFPQWVACLKCPWRVAISTSVSRAQAKMVADSSGVMARARAQLKSALRVLAIAVFPSLALGQGPLPQFVITPANPTAIDVIHVAVNTFAPCYPDGPTGGVAVAVSGFTVRITARLTCVGLTPPPPFSFMRDVGPLPAGTYSVEYWAAYDGAANPHLVIATLLSVSAAEPIPALGQYSLAMLMLAIGIIAAASRRARASGRIWGIATIIAMSAAYPSQTDAADPLAPEPIEALVRRQLILLFDPTHPDSPAAVDVVMVVSDPARNAALASALGSPSAAKRLLDRLQTSTQKQSELAKNPLSPRAVLEQYVVLTYSTEAAAAAAKGNLRRDPRVLSVESNGIYHYSALPPGQPNDKYYPFNPGRPYVGAYQWGMAVLNMPNAWDRVRGSAYVAALDNGIYCQTSSPCVTHPDLQGNFRPHFSVNVGSAGTNTDLDEYLRYSTYKGHGTHVAGIIAATSNNNLGVAGVCWGCSLAVLKWERTWADGPAGLTFAVDHGIEAVNMSFGDYYNGRDPAYPRFSSCSDAQYQAMCEAIAYAKERDVVLIAASGNGYEGRIQFPALHEDTIAVGGVQYGGGFWNSGYGNPGPCPSPPAQGDECGSNFGVQRDGSNQVVAPAMDVVSTFYPGYQWNPGIHCADTYGPNNGILDSGYGDCTGTSQAAPHVTGLVGLLRSINPLMSRTQIKTTILGNTTPCTAGNDKCGTGIPDAAKSVTAALGGSSVKSRLTPLFSFYSSQANDHVYTVVPQMALAALNSGELIPQPPSASIAYVPVGTATPGYGSFPIPPDCFSPCPSAATPRAMVSVFTSHVDPTNGSAELVPLYRMSWKCDSACTHVSHFYATNSQDVAAAQSLGYVIDGIEGYVFPTSKARPPGTVRLCRKYAIARDDYILFAGTGANGETCGTTDGYTKDAYGNLLNDYGDSFVVDWIGWAYPIVAPRPVYATGYLAALNLLLD